MKKINLYILITLSIYSNINAQQNIQKESKQQAAFTRSILTETIAVADQTDVPSTLTVIWNEDFGGGLPSDWINSGTPSTALWEYRGPSTSPNDTVGGQGGCSDGTPIESATRSNGFMIFDSNFLDAGFSSCGTGNGTGTAAAPHTGVLESPIIDLSSTVGKGLILSFHSFMRNFQASEYVYISNDSGLTWTQIWADEVFPNEENDPANKEFINITPWASGQANVKLRFVFEGEYYQWMIDDISISEGLHNDMLISKTFIDGYDLVKREYYSRIPIDLINSDTLTLTSINYNYGKNDQPNVKTVFEVKRGATFCFSDTVTNPLVASADRDTVFSADFMNTCDKGNLVFTYKVLSDSTDNNNVNNTINRNIIITDSTLARDNQTIQWVYTYSTDRAIGMYFNIEQDMVLSSFSASLYNPTGSDAIGSLLNFSFYRFEDDGSLTLVTQNDFYEVKSTDVVSSATLKTFRVPPVALTKGDYMAAIEVVFGSLYILTEATFAPSGYVLNTTNFYDQTLWRTASHHIPLIRLNFNACAIFNVLFSKSNPNGGDNGTITANPSGGKEPYSYQWATGDTTKSINGLSKGVYYVTVTDANGCSKTDSVTLVAVGINEKYNNSNILVYPNPSDEVIHISSLNTLDIIEKVSIINIVGQEVFTNTFRENLVQIKSSQLVNGIYSIKVYTADGGVSTKQIVIKH